MASIGERLKESREELKMSKAEMARLLEAQYNTYCKWESDYVTPGPGNVFTMATTLDWPWDEIEPMLDLPTKPDVLRQILIRALEEGVSRKQIAQAIGMTPSYFYAWCRGDKPVTKIGLEKLEDFADNMGWELDYEESLYEGQPRSGRKGVGGVINYTLIMELEFEFGQLTFVPEDDPRLKVIREELRA